MINKLSSFDWLAVILVIIGGLNWGLVGLFGFDLVAWLLGDMSVVARAVYILVGLSAVYLAALSMKLGKK